MDEQQRELRRRREKQKQIQRLKTNIVAGLIIIILFLLISCIALTIRVTLLRSNVKKINNRLQQVEDEINDLSDDNTQDGSDDSDSDDSAAEETSQRTIFYTGAENVKLADKYDGKYGVTEHQEIFLTFDDGPSDNTEEILDILDKYGVKATFFTIGKTDDESKERYKMIVDRGHTLAMHSYTHNYKSLYASVKSFKKEIVKEQDYLESITGEKPWLFRFPGGSSNTVSNADMKDLISYLNSAGITYFDWNVDSGDAKSNSYTVDEFIDNVMKDVGLHSTAVILMHDTNAKSTTVKALDKLLPILLTRDADIKAIDKNTELVQHIDADSVD